MNDRSFRRRLSDYADGRKPLTVRAGWEAHREKKSEKEKRRPQTEPSLSLAVFFRRYRIVVCAFLALLLAVLLLTALTVPPFGDERNPVNNEVVAHYVGLAEEETGAENVIAGMILNYRGFDTFGESTVLFVAVCCVMLLLWADERNSSFEEQAAERETESPDPILSRVSRALIPCLLCFGVSVLMGGHLSPGGGFSGGSVLGATLILFAVSFGGDAVRRFFTGRVFQVIRITGLAVYASMFGLYIFFGANGIDSNISRYIVSVIDVAVGLVVMSTMYGFYAFFTKGDL